MDGVLSLCLYLWDSPIRSPDCAPLALAGVRSRVTSRLHVWRFIEVHDDVISASGPKHAGAGWEIVSSC